MKHDTLQKVVPPLSVRFPPCVCTWPNRWYLGRRSVTISFSKPLPRPSSRTPSGGKWVTRKSVSPGIRGTFPVCNAFIVLTSALALARMLDLIELLYRRRPDAATKPIKGYLQLLKIFLTIVAVILMIAMLINRNPLILLSGLGAMAAVLMLIFQDTLLSLVASIQLGTNDMVRIGDWIEMPSQNADGNVIEVALHTVKVQNWDKTITTIPVRKLITDSFKNWRGMQESGGRRIKRALYLDQRSVRFLSDSFHHS